MNRDSLGLTECLVEFIDDFSLGDVPETVLERVRHLALDGFACGLQGAHLPWSEVAVEALGRLSGGGSSSPWAWDLPVSPDTAALLNGSFVQGFELDDFHQRGALHSSAAVLPSAVASINVMPHVDVNRFFKAVVLGYEIGPRVGIAMGGARMVVDGWHSGAISGTVASAVTSSVILGLSGRELESAIGIAVTQAGGLMGAQFSSMVKRMHHGFAARNGVIGATLASHGYTGIPGIFERPYGGLFSTFCKHEQTSPDSLVLDLGTVWEATKIGVKQYPCMIGIHSTIDALLQLLDEAPCGPENIEHVSVQLDKSVVKRTNWRPSQPIEVITAQMNVRVVAALVILDKFLTHQSFSAESLSRAALWTLLDKIDVEVADATFTEVDRHRSRVSIVLTSGRSVAAAKLSPGARAGGLLSNAEVLAKYETVMARVASDGRTSALRDWVLSSDTDSRRVDDLVSGLRYFGPE